MKKIIIISALLLIAYSLLPTISFAQSPGSLDLSFDVDGKVVTDFGSDDYGQTVLIQIDGKILVIGYSSGIAIAKYNIDGSLDNSFDSDGKLIVDSVGGVSAVLQPDGKILVAGQTFNGSDLDFSLVRINSDGSLDNSFDVDGKVVTDFGGIDDYGGSVILQPDGKIIVAGASGLGIFDFALARYNTNGSLDTSFDSDGLVITDFGGSDDYATSIALQSDGKIVVAGLSGGPGAFDFALARYNSNGSLDNTFDGDGQLTTDFAGGDDDGYSLAIQLDGKIVVAGVTFNGSGDFALARYNTDGSLDNTFDSDGKLTTDFTSSSDGGYSVALQPDGKILMAGYSGTFGDFALARYNSNGSLDTTFDSDGKLTTAIGSNNDHGQSVVLQNDGKIIVAGYSYNGVNNDFAVARYISGLNMGLIDFSLDNNAVLIYPNPIAQDSKLEYILNSKENISISLFDMQGKILKTYVNNEMQEAGSHSQILALPEDMASGSYFIVISTPSAKVSLKIIK